MRHFVNKKAPFCLLRHDLHVLGSLWLMWAGLAVLSCDEKKNLEVCDFVEIARKAQLSSVQTLKPCPPADISTSKALLRWRLLQIPGIILETQDYKILSGFMTLLRWRLLQEHQGGMRLAFSVVWRNEFVIIIGHSTAVKITWILMGYHTFGDCFLGFHIQPEDRQG